jgi:hypothetical protein
LTSGRQAGLQVDGASLQGAVAFCEFVTGNDGLVGYIDPKSAGATVTGPFDDRFRYHYTTMTALGLCIRIYAQSDLEVPFVAFGAKRLIGDLPSVTGELSSIDYYYWHYGTLALHELDGPTSPLRNGKYWSPWEKTLTEAILPLQDPSENACSQGGWLVSDRWGSYSGAGPLYNTAMNVLTLETLLRD